MLVPPLLRRRPRRFAAGLGDGRPTPGPASDATVPARAVPAAGVAAGGEFRLLIVDDDRLMTDFLPRRILRTMPGTAVRILTANTPEDGISLAASERPHVVLCDYNLRTSLTGLDVLSEVARTQPAAIRILFSGHTRDEIGPELENAPIHAFLEKPMRVDDMIPELLRVLRDEAGLEAGGGR